MTPLQNCHSVAHLMGLDKRGSELVRLSRYASVYRTQVTTIAQLRLGDEFASTAGRSYIKLYKPAKPVNTGLASCVTLRHVAHQSVKGQLCV